MTEYILLAMLQAHSSFKSKLGRQRTSKEHGAAAAALQQAIMDDRGPDLAGSALTYSGSLCSVCLLPCCLRSACRH